MLRELVEKIHTHMLEFARGNNLDVDSGALRDNIRRHLASTTTVVAPESLERVGYRRLAVMIDTAARYELTLGELMAESIDQGCNRSALIARDLRNRRREEEIASSRPKLRIVT